MRTGTLHYCETTEGLIGTVYNDKVTEAASGLFGVGDNNKTVFEECEKLGGETYKTSKSSGKSSRVTRFACVVDGAYVLIHKS